MFIVDDAIEKGQLVEILSEYKPEPFGLYAVKLSRKFTSAKVNAFIAYLKAYYGDS